MWIHIDTRHFEVPQHRTELSTSFLCNQSHLSYSSISCYYVLLTQRDKRYSLLQATVIATDIHLAGENSHMTYAHPWTCHVWQPFTETLPSWNRSTTTVKNLGPNLVPWSHRCQRLTTSSLWILILFNP
jgi:hypothetical protein